MNFRLTMAAALIAAASLAASTAQAADKAAVAKKQTTTKKAKAPAAPTVEDQIKALREEMQAQINGLKSTLAEKDTQLQQAQQAAAAAQAAAAKAQDAASAQQQAVTENSSAVNTLQSTVSDMRNANALAVSSISDDLSKTAKKTDLSDIAVGKFKIGATVFTDWSYWSDYDGSTTFVDNQQKPTAVADSHYNAFEVTRTYFNLLFLPNKDISVRITPDIYRPQPCTSTACATDKSLVFRLKYAYVDLNTLFAANKYLSKDKVTFGQTQNPLTDWEEGLTGHRYTYKMPMDFASGLSSTYLGAKVGGPIEFHGKQYLDYSVGVFTNGSYSSTELSDTKQFMGRTTYYPMGTKADRTGLGVTIFGNVAFQNVNPSSTSTRFNTDRMALMAHYQTADKAYLITGQYNLNHNVSTNGVTSSGFALEGNARLGGAKSPFHAFAMFQSYEPNSNISTNDATKYMRTVGGIAYKLNKNLDIALTDSSMHYNKAAAKNDANAISVYTQFSF